MSTTGDVVKEDVLIYKLSDMSAYDMTPVTVETSGDDEGKLHSKRVK
jgi:hypothetical protein